MREQPVPRSQVDYATAAKPPPRAACDFPRLVELLPRQTFRRTHRAAQTVEECIARKTPQVVNRQP